MRPLATQHVSHVPLRHSPPATSPPTRRAGRARDAARSSVERVRLLCQLARLCLLVRLAGVLRAAAAAGCCCCWLLLLVVVAVVVVVLLLLPLLLPLQRLRFLIRRAGRAAVVRRADAAGAAGVVQGARAAACVSCALARAQVRHEYVLLATATATATAATAPTTN